MRKEKKRKGRVVSFCLENKFGLHSSYSKYFSQIAEVEKEKRKKKEILQQKSYC